MSNIPSKKKSISSILFVASEANIAKLSWFPPKILSFESFLSKKNKQTGKLISFENQEMIKWFHRRDPGLDFQKRH